TTKPVSARAVRSRLAWPSCSAPIVGTRPTVRPRPRASATARRTAAMLSSRGGVMGCPKKRESGLALPARASVFVALVPKLRFGNAFPETPVSAALHPSYPLWVCEGRRNRSFADVRSQTGVWEREGTKRESGLALPARAG